MSLSAAHKAAFRREVPQEGRVWSIRDSHGFPAPGGALPFWSKQSRAKRIVGAVEAYQGFEVVEIPVSDWLDSWLPGLRRDDLLVGVNWAGPHATGFDLTPAQVAGWFEELP
ncbi:DUF2750 domain-containing protein [Winogradskya consettensis]|jgi:hypothetical protein|uniref:DUF2750 domain-containing protein n=1 Tax=Winogradskya consettensis TaxID=113560 RepID=A0A919SHQ1_9ACTN|nr:DUF2750 domain-containing protein [Actinoplanes consettensis]GIM71879.1 hypothetical protein Aco04nite_27520 [Actinoplanes consettensis]